MKYNDDIVNEMLFGDNAGGPSNQTKKESLEGQPQIRRGMYDGMYTISQSSGFWPKGVCGHIHGITCPNCENPSKKTYPSPDIFEQLSKPVFKSDIVIKPTKNGFIITYNGNDYVALDIEGVGKVLSQIYVDFAPK